MAVYNKFNSFSEAIAEKVHNLGSDTLEVALTAAANAPVAGNTILGNLTQISYTNLSARTLTVSSSSQTGGSYTLVVADKVLTATGAVATFRYVVIFNQTALGPDELICWYDHGSDVTLANGETYTVDFGAQLFTLA